MAADLEELLAPVSESNPAGDDLSYDAERQGVELAFEVSISADTAESDTDWRDILRLIKGQSKRTKDVWLAVYYCRAGARLGEIDAVEVGAQYLAGLLELFWDDVHPRLDEYGFQGRKGPCESLTRIGEFLGPLRRIVLLRHPRLGEYNGEDFARFATEGSQAEGYGMFRAALEDVGGEGLRAILDQIDRIRDGIRRVDAALISHAEGDTGTNFTSTYDVLEAIRRGVSEFAVPDDARSEPATGDVADDLPLAGGGASSVPAVMGGKIDSREDVVRAIDAIVDYYRRREPASPLPTLLTRARTWVGSDFLTILEDMAPDSLQEVRRVLVSQRESGE